MYKLKKNGKVFTSKSVGTGRSSYDKRIYRAAVSQRLRNTALAHWGLLRQKKYLRHVRDEAQHLSFSLVRNNRDQKHTKIRNQISRHYLKHGYTTHWASHYLRCTHQHSHSTHTLSLSTHTFYEGESNENLKYIQTNITDDMVCSSMAHIQMCGYFIHCYAAIFLHDGSNCCIALWCHYSVCLTGSRRVCYRTNAVHELSSPLVHLL